MYDEVRRPFVQNIQEMSLEAGKIVWLENSRMHSYTAEESACGKIPLDELMDLVTEDSSKLQHWTWSTSPTDEIEAALKLMKAEVSSEKARL